MLSPPILFLVLTLFPLLTSSTGNTAEILRDACERASRDDPNITYDFCISCLGPSSGQASTIQDLVLVSLGLATSNATEIRSRIKRLLKGGEFGNDPYAKACLRDCVELYSDAKSNLRGVVKVLEEKDYAKANIVVSVVMDASVTCEDGFREKEGVVSPLTEENDVFFRLSAICLALIAMLR